MTTGAFTSDLAVHDGPLGAEVIDDTALADLLARIGVTGGETAAPVSAFNSSI